MRFLPPAAFRPANLAEVRAPAVLLPLDKYDEPFLVLGEGANAMVCFLGENHQFVAFSQSEAQNFKGLAIEDVWFDVDLDSRYSLDGNHQAPGSLIRSGKALELVVRGERGSYPRLSRITVADDLAAATENERVGFLRWRANVTHLEEVLTIWSVTVGPSTNPE